MDNLEYFCKLNITSNIVLHIKNKIQNSAQTDWHFFLDQSILQLELSDFNNDPQIIDIINNIGDANRLSVFRNEPNTCYSWHQDTIRNSAINILIDGFDSMCIFGEIAPNKKFTNTLRLCHQPNTYYLMNVKKFHTVYNFNNNRYIISLGLPEKRYKDAIEYLKKENLL
jgi:hypothetical protein